MKHFLVYNCNFCGAQKIRFDVFATTIQDTKQNNLHYWEAYCQCSHCKKGSILKIFPGPNFSNLSRLVKVESRSNLCSINETNINDHFQVFGVAIPPSKEQIECPNYVPETIKNIFDEAAKCLAMNCFVASGSMFRLCLDLVTKDLLKKWLEENQTSEQQPNKDQRNKLANRIDFLIDQEKIPKRLQELAHCIRHDGNDSTHDGNTGEDEALDCLDFTEALLTEIYTLPEQINAAQRRRLERRAKS